MGDFLQKSGFSVLRFRRISSVLEGYLERGEIAGAVTLIHRNGEEAYADAIGWLDKEDQSPMRRDTLFFRIMRMTKPVTAVAALLLVEEDKIRLFDPIDAWLPELANRMVLRDPKVPPRGSCIAFDHAARFAYLSNGYWLGRPSVSIYLTQPVASTNREADGS